MIGKAIFLCLHCYAAELKAKQSHVFFFSGVHTFCRYTMNDATVCCIQNIMTIPIMITVSRELKVPCGVHTMSVYIHSYVHRAYP